MFGVEFMTDKERKATLKSINDLEDACKVDEDEILRSAFDFDADMSLCVHINMLKCEVLGEMGKPIVPLKAEDYAEICKLRTEEERRKKLVEILVNKEKERIATMNENPNLGKVLKRKDDPAQPVMAPVAEKDAEVGGIAVDRLRSLIERIERLQEETKALASDMRDIFAEAKSAGFDVKIMREILKLRKMDAADRDEKEFLLETYRKALDL